MNEKEFKQVCKALSDMTKQDESFVLACDFEDVLIGMKIASHTDFCLLICDIIDQYVKNSEVTFEQVICDIIAVQRLTKNAKREIGNFDKDTE